MERGVLKLVERGFMIAGERGVDEGVGGGLVKALG